MNHIVGTFFSIFFCNFKYRYVCRILFFIFALPSLSASSVSLVIFLCSILWNCMAHRISNWFMILSTLLFFPVSLSLCLSIGCCCCSRVHNVQNVHACYYSSASFTCVMLIKALLFNRIHIFTLSAPRTAHILRLATSIDYDQRCIKYIRLAWTQLTGECVFDCIQALARSLLCLCTQLAARDVAICCVPYRHTMHWLPWWSLLLPSTANCSPKIALLFHWKSKCIFRFAICPFYQR